MKKTGIHTQVIISLFLWAFVQGVPLAAATRLGLHVTQEELKRGGSHN